MIKKFLRLKRFNDKINHLIYGIAIYLMLSMFLGIDFSIIATIITAIFVEIVDMFNKNAKTEILDVIYTITIPILIYCITKIFINYV